MNIRPLGAAFHEDGRTDGQIDTHADRQTDLTKLVVPYLYCCTVHLVDSLIITQPTNARIVFHLF